MSAADLERPLHHDELVHQTALGYLDSTVADGSLPVTQSVLAVLGPLLPAGPPTIGLISQHFGVHPKALQRRLAAEGTTFTALLDQVRRQAAELYLRDPTVTLAHLARQLGYAEPSVLTRACQRWFGMTPTQYRDRSGARHRP